MPRPGTEYTWNPSLRRYQDDAGRIVSRLEVRHALDRAIEYERRRTLVLADRLRSGDMSLAEWRAAMRKVIKNTHTYSAMLAKGGADQMNPADYGFTGNLIKAQYKYLENFVRQIGRGLPLDGRFTQRVQMYVEAGRGTYHALDQRLHRLAGMTEERNVLHPADHCVECVDMTSFGWVPIGTLVPIGSRICKTRCKCTLAYR